MTQNREDKALHEFKSIMEDLLHLVVQSTKAETGYLYWVNRARKQFVLESNFTNHTNAMFRDRVAFNDYFLNEFKEIKHPVQVRVGSGITEDSLSHYHDYVPIKHLTLIPFRNNNATVAITVLETKDKIDLENHQKIISSYVNAHVNVLNTYLELTELYEDQQEWIDYDKALDKLSPKLEKVNIIENAMELMQNLLPGGGVLAVMRGMDSWVSVLRSSKAPEYPSVGLMTDQKSMTNEALEKGESIFSIHFNQNPKRLSVSEKGTEGATLAIPLMISDRRQGVILSYHSNPLIFKESIKHQLNNAVRLAALAIQSNINHKDARNDVFTNQHGSFIREVWELCLEKQLKRVEFAKEHTWFGFISIANLSELRSRLRLDDLNRLQKIMVKALNPSRLGYRGFIGFNTDYVFTYIFLDEEEKSHEKWQKAILDDFGEKLDLGNGSRVEIQINFGAVKLESGSQQSHEIINDAKYSLSDAIKQPDTQILNK